MKLNKEIRTKALAENESGQVAQSVDEFEIEFSTQGGSFPRTYPCHRTAQLQMIRQANREITRFLSGSGFSSPDLTRGRGKRLITLRKLRSHFDA